MLLVPLLLLCLLLMFVSLTCGRLELHHGGAGSAIQVVDSIEQDGYSVHLLWDVGPPVGSTLLWVEQEKTIVPGLQLVRVLDTFSAENPVGKLTSEGSSTIRVRMPANSYRPEEVTRVYRLRRWVYF